MKTRRSLSRLALLATLVTMLTALPAMAGGPELSGSFKSLNIHGESDPADLFGDYRFSSNRLRFNLAWPMHRSFHLEAALDHQLLWTDPPGIVPLPGNGVNRRVDLDKTWDHDEDWASRTQLDRLNLRWQAEHFDFVLGRQAIGFGRILLFSPLDLVAPFAPDAIDTDVRSGADALRLTWYYGLDGQLGGALVWGDDTEHNTSLLTWSDNRYGIDLLALGGSLRDRPMVGVGIAGNLGTLGLKGELALYRGRGVGTPGEDLNRAFGIGAIELWYRFDNGLTLIAQYLYNGPGTSDVESYREVLASAPLREGLTYLLGRHYMMFAPSYELHPLATLQGLVIVNLEDDSRLIRPTLSLDLSDSTTLELFWTLHGGREPAAEVAFLPPEPRSEFGLRGDSGGFFLKFYF